MENQAFDRVHRLGQKLDVEIYRLVITNTVEARVLELQSRKVRPNTLAERPHSLNIVNSTLPAQQNLMDGSLGEGTAKRQQRTSAQLFIVYIK